MEKVTLTFVGRYTTKKDGSPLIGGNGKPYTSLRIKTNEHGDKFMSGFDNAQTKDWKVGDTVEIDVEQNGEYLNFSVPRAARPGSGMSSEQFERLYKEVYAARVTSVQILQALKDAGIVKDLVPGTSVEYPKETAKEVDWNPKDAEAVTFNGVDPEMESLMQSAEEAMS